MQHNYENGITALVRAKYGIAADSDSYKLSQSAQYVKGATRMAAYIESRGGKYDKTVWFGLQMIIKEYLMGTMTQVQVDNLIAWSEVHMNGNTAKEFKIALDTVVSDYNGKMPIRIRSVKEGAIVPTHNVLAIIETMVRDPRIFALVGYFETLLMRVWGPTTVATTSYHVREIIMGYLNRSSDDPKAEIDFKLHDFGSRAVMPGAAGFAGAGHLAIFKGTDTMAAAHVMEFAYGADMAGYSIPASEHSTTTSHGPDGEENFVSQMFDNFAHEGSIFATVADSYDVLSFIRTLTPKFKERLKASGATWVIRPDSGDAIKMPIKCVEELDLIFGHTVNSKGYKVLNNVRVIQGDGIGPDDVDKILRGLIDKKYSASNIAFGMGGGLLQKVNRDTQKFSMKCCAIEVDGEWRGVHKDPAVYDDDWNRVTEQSFKTSKRGIHELMYNTQTGGYETMSLENVDAFSGKFGWEPALELVYEGGTLFRDMTLEEVRNNAGV